MIVNKHPQRLVLIVGNIVCLYHDRRRIATWEAEWQGADAPAIIEQVRTAEIK